MSQVQGPLSSSDARPSKADRPALEVWAVFQRNDVAKGVQGFIIIDGERVPNLYAYVEGAAPMRAVLASMIASGRLSPEEAMDLRGRPIPSWVFSSVLFRVFSLTPRRDAGEPQILAAMFVPHESGVVSQFTVISAYGLERLRERHPANSSCDESRAE
ncbi:MAG: hypothetical protein ABSB74_19420 [Tepidisphaeraceae bacterium]